MIALVLQLTIVMQKILFAIGGVKRKGFALPTVLISSVILLGVLAVAVGAVTATRTALESQRYTQLSKEASEAGIQMAIACIDDGYLTWDDPLRPGSDCYGASTPCSAEDCYVVYSDNIKTSFEVSSPTIAGDISTVNSKGLTERTRTSTGTVWKTYNATTGMQDTVEDVNPGEELSWTDVSISNTHACGVAFNGELYCWGDNSFGQLGNGTSTPSTTPVAVLKGSMPADSTVVKVSTGVNYTCAIASDGKAYCWGTGSSGQLGNGATSQRNTPSPVARGAMPADMIVNQITTGNAHACAVASNSKAYCWGVNSYGEVGNGTKTQASSPVAVSLGAMPAGSTVSQIDAGTEQTCAIASNNKGYCWGAGDSGRLGTGGNADATTPAAVAQGAMPAGATLIQIQSGWGTGCAIASNNMAYCWGNNSDGRLGNGSTATSFSPVAVAMGAMPTGTTVRHIDAANVHTCVIASNDNTYCWGQNGLGQLGTGDLSNPYTSYTPRLATRGSTPAGESFDTFVARGSSTCGLTTSGKLLCWGYGGVGMLGAGNTNNAIAPTNVSSVYDKTRWPVMKGLVTGGGHTCALASNNQAYCWGVNSSGQLGDSSTIQKTTPTAISQGAIPAGATLRQISAGSNHTCALASNNQAYCWGSGGNGLLGNGTTTNQTTPVAVSQGVIPAGVTLRQISAGGNHTCALASNNQAYCWGSGGNGLLGNGTTTDQTTPVAVSQGAIPAGVTLRQISAGGNHTCALASNNQAYCWGLGVNGQLGNGTTTPQTTPVAALQGANSSIYVPSYVFVGPRYFF